MTASGPPSSSVDHNRQRADRAGADEDVCAPAGREALLPAVRLARFKIVQIPSTSRCHKDYPIPRSGRLYPPMNRYVLLLAVFTSLATAQASASVPAPTSTGSKTHGPALQMQSQTPPPPTASTAVPAHPGRFYTVSDVKGLMLTCIAPEIDTNADTDLFKSCTLAPGRTLDDVMHTFIQGIHYEQSQFEKEREVWQRALEEKTAQRSAQK